MRRVMCVWFPLWPIQRIESERPAPDAAGSTSTSSSTPARPLVLFEEGRRGLQVVVCSPAAAEWGIRPGMPLGEAQSLLPHPTLNRPFRSAAGRNRHQPQQPPLIQRVDPIADRARLQSLAQHCQIYSPLVGLEDGPTPESIWLDLSGSEQLFGGEAALARQVHTDLGTRKIQVRIAVADTWGAAWAVSHFGKTPLALVPSEQQVAWLSPLPIAALRLTAEAQRSLKLLSVLTIGQLLKLPRASLPSRFGKDLVRRIDQALGTAQELLTAERPAEPLRAEWLFDEPVQDRPTLDHVCEVLLERLLTVLDQRRAGLRELACHWLGTTVEPAVLRLLRPTTDRRHLLNLLQLQAERRLFPSGVLGVRMEVVDMAIPPVRQATLFDDDSADNHPQALSELVERLSVRLGRRAVLRSRLVPDPQPEFACESTAWLEEQGAKDETRPVAAQLRSRPLRLLPAPEPLSVQTFSAEGWPIRVNQSAVCGIRGPERIATGWWRGPDIKRDYYCFELTNGATLWVFLDQTSRRWFLHGLFV